MQTASDINASIVLLTAIEKDLPIEEQKSFSLKMYMAIAHWYMMQADVGNWSIIPQGNFTFHYLYRSSLVKVFKLTKCLIYFRVIIDRAVTPWDSTLNELDLSPTGMTSEPQLAPFVSHIKDNSL